MTLDEFRLETYDERSLLITALQLLREERPYVDADARDALLLRLSRTECQSGGCSYCNADRAREEDEWRADD